jgi:hypothetical protein
MFLEILSVDNWMEYIKWKIEECHVFEVTRLLQLSYNTKLQELIVFEFFMIALSDWTSEVLTVIF